VKYLHLLFILVLFTSCNTSNKTAHQTASDTQEALLKGPLEEPQILEGENRLQHSAYSFVYSEIHEQSKWVAYQLKKSELQKNTKRSNRFKADKSVSSLTASNKDYRKSGYDKGHLAPAADMVWDKTAMNESFYFSNISPQLPGFNRGIWKRLEGDVREWAEKYDSIFVVTGPVFKGVIETIGENDVSVPSHFFKAILVYSPQYVSSIAFLFPHEKCKGSEFDYAVSVDSVEAFTGLDLFYRLPDKLENSVEQSVDITAWKE